MGLASKSHQSASPFALQQMDKERKGREREIEYIQMEDVRMRQIAQVVILWNGAVISRTSTTKFGIASKNDSKKMSSDPEQTPKTGCLQCSANP